LPLFILLSLETTNRVPLNGGWIGTRTLLPFQQLTLNYLGLAGTALALLIGPCESQERRSAMLKMSVSTTAHNSIAEYSIVVACNKCAGLHEMGICVTIPNGPVQKQSVGDLYVGKGLPKSLADLPNTSVSCPKTGRQSTQKNLHQIFLVPTTNDSPKRRPKSED
jgi:hypothetical protein